MPYSCCNKTTFIFVFRSYRVPVIIQTKQTSLQQIVTSLFYFEVKMDQEKNGCIHLTLPGYMQGWRALIWFALSVVINNTEATRSHQPQHRMLISQLSLSDGRWTPIAHHQSGHCLLTLMTSKRLYQMEFSHSKSPGWQFAVECIPHSSGSNCFLPYLFAFNFLCH